MQGSGIWSSPPGTLGRIVQETEERVAALKTRVAEIRQAAIDAGPPTRPLFDTLRRNTVGVIAEVKRKSPSKGWINEGLSSATRALSYQQGGAAAISVLTEPRHFDGSVEDLEAVVGAVSVPVLKKDFHIDPIQLAEARAHGATAALLIARAIMPEMLADMIDEARAWHLETIVEVRDERELQRAIDCGARIIGINNRDLETLVIDPATSERLLPLIPGGIIAIAESGMSTKRDVERVADLGADAVLIGSSLSASADPTALLGDLTSVLRVARG